MSNVPFTATIKHCDLPTCADVRERDGRCYCMCEDCKTCTCGCNNRGRSGFDQLGRGVYKGRGAGYTLLQRVDRWDVLDANGETIRDLGSMPRTLDEANIAATLYARRAGHGHA